MTKFFGSFVASAVAGLVVSSPVLANEPAKKAEGEKMACQNNSCKGKSGCMGFGNANCAGKNECKGHGTMKAKDEAGCKKAGGTWAAPKK